MKNILIKNTFFINNTVITIDETKSMNRSKIFYIVAPFLSEVCESGFNNFIYLRYMWAPRLKFIGDRSFSDCTSLFRIDGEEI